MKVLLFVTIFKFSILATSVKKIKPWKHDLCESMVKSPMQSLTIYNRTLHWRETTKTLNFCEVNNQQHSEIVSYLMREHATNDVNVSFHTFLWHLNVLWTDLNVWSVLFRRSRVQSKGESEARLRLTQHCTSRPAERTCLFNIAQPSCALIITIYFCMRSAL